MELSAVTKLITMATVSIPILNMAVDEEETSVVIRMINSAAVLRSETLDLGRKGICEVPKEILNLKCLESLHLEGNYITELPEEFFEKLTSLKWLDLRNNRLSALPISVGRHRSLRSLLLEGNSLTHLPCELGMVKSVCGLNLSGNPLEFPPPYIVKKGTQEILKYLREMCEKDGKCPESGSSDQESEMDYFNSGVDEISAGAVGYSAGGSRRSAVEEHDARRMHSFKLPPIVRNATIVRRSNTEISDERESIQGQTVKKFEPVRRSTWASMMMPFNNETIHEVQPSRKRRNKQDDENSQNVKMEEERPAYREEKLSDSLKKIKIKKKRVPKKAKKAAMENRPFTNNHEEDAVTVGDMVAIRVPVDQLIKGQPCVGKVVTEAGDKDFVMVHYYIGTCEDSFRPMMSRSSPYLRQVPLGSILCKFEMQTNGRVSPRTTMRIKDIVEGSESDGQGK